VLRIYCQKAVTPNTDSIAVNGAQSSSGLLNRSLCSQGLPDPSVEKRGRAYHTFRRRGARVFGVREFRPQAACQEVKSHP
jgi:hypothetical protein